MSEFLGRQVVVEVNQKLPSTVTCREALVLGDKVFCQRCGSHFVKEIAELPNGDIYCPFCIAFGRLTSRHLLASEEEQTEARDIQFTWSGTLTNFQQKIADVLIKNFQKNKHSLIWAVTGSGKTEMIFPIIAEVLKKGGRVGVTSPRIDVCREIYPRISQVFPNEKALLLYGASEERYRYSKLTVCTTHQLFHFYQAFDLLIVDEIDAFPYEGDPLLRFAVRQALKQIGNYIYLTATPSQNLLKEIKTFSIEKLPLRFHQRPLIVPELIWYESWKQCFVSTRKIRKLVRYLNILMKDNAVLVFCPSIVFMKKVYVKLSSFFTTDELTCVSAQDEQREEKVQNMREKKYRILLSTTILERGVTFENVSVIILGANHPVFSKSALVQIAGRVDRKGDFNRGRVLFFFNQQTPAIRQALKEIKEMNHLAQRWLNNEL